ncbi:hypothetical protein ACFVYD_31975 [Streptomyces sp. NPDC058301]|uniref:hypothetical protein n=1 Tax=Streptomyces sp. NPDC058301 TaxID=3346436 RepID=UPI0036E7B14D
MPEYGFVRASDEVLSGRYELPARVVTALRRAGLPAHIEGEAGSQDGAGARGEVQTDAETGSAAVSVCWSCDPGMVQAALDELTAHRVDTPAFRYVGTMGLHMQSSLIKILLSSGIIATLENDTMNPEYVLVFGMMSDLPPAFRPAFVPPQLAHQSSADGPASAV